MKSKEALTLLGVTRVTLSRYVKQGKIEVKLKENGQYDYVDDSIYKLINGGFNRKRAAYLGKEYIDSQKEQLQLYGLTDTVTYYMDLDQLISEITQYRIKEVVLLKSFITSIQHTILEAIVKQYNCTLTLID